MDVDPRLGDSGGDVGLRLRVLSIGGGTRAAILPFHTGEDGRKGVILPLQDRVELVVVAAGTVDRHAAAAGHHLRDHVIEVIGAGLTPQHVALGLDLTDEIPRACCEETGGGHRIGVVGRDHVAGDLPPNKLVVGEVGIERLDHPVAIPPGVGPKLVAFEAVGVGIVRNVEPVAGPALAVVGRGEQAVDKFFIRVGGCVGDERGHVLGRGRQADEVERQPADECAAIGLGRRSQPASGELNLDEPVNVVAGRRVGRWSWRHGGSGHRLPGPMVEPGVAVAVTGQPVGLGLGPGGARVDPLLEQCDLGGGEPVAIGRHPLLVVGARDPADQFTVAALAGDDHRPEVATLDRPVFHIEPQSALLRIRPVAVAAAADEQRPDLPLKIDGGRSIGSRCRRRLA